MWVLAFFSSKIIYKIIVIFLNGFFNSYNIYEWNTEILFEFEYDIKIFIIFNNSLLIFDENWYQLNGNKKINICVILI